MPTSSDPPDWAQVYRDSLYAFRGDDRRWRRFALDGAVGNPDQDAAAARNALGMRRSLVLITAWNPDSEEMQEEWNLDANRRLAAALDAVAVAHQEAYGASLPGVVPAWREDGFALRGLDRADALGWGREWRQRALVYLAEDRCGLLFCAGDELVPCAVRVLGDG